MIDVNKLPDTGTTKKPVSQTGNRQTGGATIGLPTELHSPMPILGGGSAGLPTELHSPMPILGGGSATNTTGGGSEMTGFNYNQIAMPQQWATATDFYNRLLQEMGRPTSASQWYEQAKAAAQYDIENAIKNAAEQAGMSGIRWSTPMGYTAQQIAAQTMARLGSEFARQQMAAEEAARQRELVAAGALTSMGQWLPQFAQSLASQAAGLGQQLYGMDLNTINALWQQFQRMTPEANPWLQYGLGLGTQSGVPQTYQPGGLTQILDLISSLIPVIVGLL